MPSFSRSLVYLVGDSLPNFNEAVGWTVMHHRQHRRFRFSHFFSRCLFDLKGPFFDRRLDLKDVGRLASGQPVEKAEHCLTHSWPVLLGPQPVDGVVSLGESFVEEPIDVGLVLDKED